MAKKKTDTGQLDLFGESNTIQLLNGQIAMIEKKILALFGSTYKYAAQLAQVRDAVNSGNASFTFQSNPAAAKEIENRLTAVAQTLDQQLAKSTEQSYALGQASTNNALVQAFGKDKQTKKELKEISDDAVAAMRKRGADGHTFYTQPQGGVTISDRVWKLTESTKLEIEIAIQNAVLEGQSADELARTIQQYLTHPDRLFRSVRVIDKETGQWTGEYTMSEAAKRCHTGQGVYRSSYKNALRLARTELTQAYRCAEWETYQDNPLITGYRIELSNNHTTEVMTKKGRKTIPLKDICDKMAGTEYPKTFLWTGWHPQCRCRMVPILVTKNDFKERVKARHTGKLKEWQPKEQTTEMPKVFVEWVNDNKSRWQANGKAAPFFIRDNYQQGDVDKGLDTRITAAIEEAKLAAATATAKAKEPKKAVPKPAPFHRATLDELKAAGFTIGKMSEKEWSGSLAESADFDFIAVKNEMEKIAKENGITGLTFQIRGNDENGFYFEIQDANLKIQLKRDFIKHPDGKIECHHSIFKLDPALQGKGISKQVFAKLYTEYQRMGVDELTVDANLDVGGYTWAKYGFAVDRATAKDFAKMFASRFAYHPDALEKKIKEFYKTHDKTEHIPMQLLADAAGSRAKDFLLGTGWEGTLDLHNPEQVAIWEEYLGLRKKEPTDKMALDGKIKIAGFYEMTQQQQKEVVTQVEALIKECNLFNKNKNVKIDFKNHDRGAIAMTWNKQTQSVTISSTKYEFHDGSIYCPAEHLQSALQKLKKGQQLTFYEEYAIESLCHESVHAEDKGSVIVKEYTLDEIIYETCTQLYAREKYVDILKHFDVEPANFEKIKFKGMGYQGACNVLRDIFTKDGILQVGELKEVANKTIRGTEQLEILCKKRGYNYNNICILLRAMISERKPLA